LSVTPLDDETVLLLDSRFNLSEPAVEFIDAEQARMALTGESNAGDGTLQWACERQCVLRVDGRWTALATANPETLSMFLKARGKSRSIPISVR
jgi:hypothetical protein